MKTFCMTIDLEQDFGGRLNTYYGVADGLPILLDLFKKYSVNATFFITGDVLKKEGDYIKKLFLKTNHDLALHGYNHIPIKHLSYIDTYEEVRTAKHIFNQVFNKNPGGYRTPYLASNKYLQSILQKEDFVYDSSICPTFFPGRFFNLTSSHNLYGLDGIVELPVSTIPFTKLPLGLSFYRKQSNIFNKLMKYSGDTIVFYAHPHEFINIPSSMGVPAFLKIKDPKQNIKIIEKLLTGKYEFKTAIDAVTCWMDENP